MPPLVLLRRIPAPRNAAAAHPVRAALAALLLPNDAAAAVFGPQVGLAAAARQGLVRWSSSSTRWKQRQGSDHLVQAAKAHNLRSRAAFKLLELNMKHDLFKKGQTVVDLGYAPGSWSQVAADKTRPGGRVVGIDLIPAQPPRGVSTIQGNFLSPLVQKLVKDYIAEMTQRQSSILEDPSEEEGAGGGDITITERPSYIDVERADLRRQPEHAQASEEERLVDIVLSDMMMNTSGMVFRDHAGSMDLCLAALQFCSDTLRTGGHFVCKFYQGSEDKALEKRLKKMFRKVHREKPGASRDESREGFFVALERIGDVRFSDTGP